MLPVSLKTFQCDIFELDNEYDPKSMKVQKPNSGLLILDPVIQSVKCHVHSFEPWEYATKQGQNQNNEHQKHKQSKTKRSRGRQVSNHQF